MRRLALILAAALFAGIGAVAPASAPTVSAATGPKVAIIVGATHGLTANYRSYADQVYAEAIRYTSNVVKVYSPNATWANVKAAVNGASIIVYLGHGNGWPSPYTYDPNYTTKDGFGLNYDLNGDGRLSDYENRYYGEPSIRTLTAAPNAVVLLFHLCYAAGSSEPGGAAPSLSTARQRVDNYAAAFLRTSVRAVVAIGHSHSPYYIRELFTSRQTIEQYFVNAPDFNGNLLPFDSTRSPGYSVRLDPDDPTSGYYRALTGKMSLTTSEVTGAAFADTSTDPASFVVPGNASPLVDGAPVFGSVENAMNGLAPAATISMTDRVWIDARESVSSLVDGSSVFRVRTSQGIGGWMTGAALRPRDSAAPRIWEVDDATGAFSPNGDGSQDAYQVSARLSEPSSWTIRIEDASGQERARQAGAGDTAGLTWAPQAGSAPDGMYRWVVEAEDAWGNGPLPAHGSFEIDTRAPDVSVADAVTDVVPVLSPNGDGSGDTIAFAVGASEPGRVVGTVRDATSREVDTTAVSVGSATASLTWDGRDASGTTVADGTYTVVFAAEDRAGNRSQSQARTVAVYGSLSRVRASTPLFYPQDGDSLAARTALSFSLVSAATVTWTIVNAAGATVRTIMTDQPLAAGPQEWSWDGRNDTGVFVARGRYTTVVRATDGTLGATLRASVIADAFRIVASDTTPARSQAITVTITTAESLMAAPRLTVVQPGISAWSVATTRVASGVYRVTIRLKASSAGTLRLKAYGTDSGGRSQYSSLSLPLH